MNSPVVELAEVARLRRNPRNVRRHPAWQVEQLADMIRAFGFNNPVLIDERDELIAGHGRLEAVELLQGKVIPAIRLVHLTEVQKRAYALAENQLTLRATWDVELLKSELLQVQDAGLDLSLSGFSVEELDALLQENPGEPEPVELVEANMPDLPPILPTTVFYARDGWWQTRKKRWVALGIQSELGRVIKQNNKGIHTRKQRKANSDSVKKITAVSGSASSVFDPVLCEVLYELFCPSSGLVLDPFAGGSVRGVVAAMKGRQYVGNELRAEQVEANRAQWEEIDVDGEAAPVWHAGDSRRLKELLPDVRADMVFSCPPYADLEVYSDDPADLSKMPYPAFLEAYRDIVRQSCDMLRDDRCASCVVGDVRDDSGAYRGFVADTIEAFEAAGLALVSEAILVTAIGSLPLQAGQFFSRSRKVAKTHQNVLIFLKGDKRRALSAVRS